MRTLAAFRFAVCLMFGSLLLLVIRPVLYPSHTHPGLLLTDGLQAPQDPGDTPPGPEVAPPRPAQPFTQGPAPSLSFFKEYDTEVDFRIIVITYSRAASLNETLYSMVDLEMDGDKVSMEIWVDRDKNGRVHDDVIKVAQDFRWGVGPKRVHVHNAHVGLYGQWLRTWRPRAAWDPVTNTTRVSDREMALFVEDDVSVSRFCYRFLKGVRAKVKHRQDIALYGLQDENAKYTQERSINAPETSPIFMYKVPGSWGVAPVPGHWYDFQNWFLTQRFDVSYRPYTPEAGLFTSWYRIFEKNRKEDSMWTMWFIRYLFDKKLYATYSNLPKFLGRHNVSMEANRREKGLHFYNNKKRFHIPSILSEWDPKILQIPDNIPMFWYNGRMMNKP